MAKRIHTGHKTVTLHHHHSKPYRKRHIGFLVISVIAAFILLATAVQYRFQIAASVMSSANFVSDLFFSTKLYDTKVRSSFGFDITYDQKKFYASAIDATSGSIFFGTDLSENRAYNVIRIAPSLVDYSSSQSALTLTYHHETTFKEGGAPELADLQSLAFSDALLTQASFEKQSSTPTTIGGQVFDKSIWRLKQSSALTAYIQSEVVIYTAVINNQAITMVINYGLSGSDSGSIYDPVIASLNFSESEKVSVTTSQQLTARTSTNRTLLDSVLFNNIAGAATAAAAPSVSEKIAALYGSAVTKLYNVYSMDISIDGQSYLTNVFGGGTGSGFFVSQDGYIATNGHVVTADPKSIIIEDAIAYAQRGDSRYLVFLMNIAGLQPSDFTGDDENKNLGILVDGLYKIEDSRITKTNYMNNLLVGLTDKQPDITALVDATKARNEYPVQDTIKRAKLVASDYRAVDGVDGYRASDVAIIKIEGSNYPVAKLGTLSSATQGADLMILGYPGNASDNGLVESTVSTVTLTTGKISSIKNASGSEKKLIETDTTIGHGNSGGPAFVNSGEVIGIATYTIDGSGSGDGVYNYVRDIKDLVDLADSSSINFDTVSATQSEWEKGIDDFYTAHYSRALESFNKAKTLYPYNPRAEEFIAAANTRIANGEDVQDFPILAVAIGGFILLVGAGVAVVLIIRHKKRHIIYKDQVNQGAMAPLVPGSAPQQVQVSGMSGPVMPPLVSTQTTTDAIAPTAAPIIPSQPQSNSNTSPGLNNGPSDPTPPPS